jgi:hypothetical protein
MLTPLNTRISTHTTHNKVWYKGRLRTRLNFGSVVKYILKDSFRAAFPVRVIIDREIAQ